MRKDFNRTIGLHRLNWLEKIALVISFWFAIFPRPYQLLFVVVAILPILGLLLNGVSRPSLASLISISEENGKSKYDVADFLEIPGLVIGLRVLLDFVIDSYTAVLVVGSVGLVVTLAVLLLTHKLVERSNKNSFIIYTSVAFNVLLYGYATPVAINCIFDSSDPQFYSTKVLEKRMSKGSKHTTYYLRVQPWGHHRDAEDISVPRSKYNSTAKGDMVTIQYHKGLFGIPWYAVREK